MNAAALLENQLKLGSLFSAILQILTLAVTESIKEWFNV